MRWHASDRTPASNVAVMSTAWVGLRAAAEGDEPDAAPGLAALAEHPRVAGVAHGVEQRPADRPVVGVVPARPAPRVAVVDRQHDVGPVAADRRGEVGAQLETLDDEPSGWPRNSTSVDADLRGSRRAAPRAGSARPPRAASTGSPPRRRRRARSRPTCPARSSGPPRRRRRTPCRRDGRRPPARAPSPPAAAPDQARRGTSCRPGRRSPLTTWSRLDRAQEHLLGHRGNDQALRVPDHAAEGASAAGVDEALDVLEVPLVGAGRSVNQAAWSRLIMPVVSPSRCRGRPPIPVQSVAYPSSAAWRWGSSSSRRGSRNQWRCVASRCRRVGAGWGRANACPTGRSRARAVGFGQRFGQRHVVGDP